MEKAATRPREGQATARGAGPAPGQAKEAAPSKGERTRRRIVGHATQLIYEKGYSKTTVEEVIEAAGITKGSFYFHFPSKEELGYAVIENASSHILEKIEEALERPGLTPYRRIEAMLKEIQGIVEAADCSRGCILGNLALEMSHTHPGFRERIAQAFKGWSSLIAGELEEMKREGELPPDFDCSAYADFALSSLEGGIMMSKVTMDPAPMRNSISMILEQFAAQKAGEAHEPTSRKRKREAKGKEG
jgi:TetR/AcrR family transcriptional repressor of nem operon